MYTGSLSKVINESVIDKVKSIPGKINNKVDDLIRWKADSDATNTASDDYYGLFKNKRKIYRDQFNQTYKQRTKQFKDEEKEEDKDWKNYMKEQKKKKMSEAKSKYKDTISSIKKKYK